MIRCGGPAVLSFREGDIFFKLSRTFETNVTLGDLFCFVGFTVSSSFHIFILTHAETDKLVDEMMRIPFKTNKRALLLSHRSLSLHQTVKQKRNASSVVPFQLCDWQKERRVENVKNTHHYRRCLSSGGGGGSWSSTRGHDITMESLMFGNRPKVIMEGYTPVGFHVYNTIKKINDQDPDDGSFHLYGSIMAFPFGCFLWKVSQIKDITLESLYPVMLHRPAIECLFIGCNTHDGHQQIPLAEMDRIRLAFLKQNIVVEQMDVGIAMGTFNILNAEDRQVAVALLVDSNSAANE
jgi:uncharacterized protein